MPLTPSGCRGRLISAWAVALIPAVGGIIVAILLKVGTRPEKVAGMAYVIDGVAERGGRLNDRNGFVFVLASAVAYALARRFQPGSAYTFALPAAGIHLRPGAFQVDRR